MRNLQISLLALFFTVSLCVSAHARPNIVVVTTDDQDVASVATMPHLRALIQQHGVTFTNSFMNFALCCPSRATFLTGQHSTNHGVRSNVLPHGGYTKLDHTNTLPVWLQSAGYKTALVGKYLNRYGKDVPPTTVPPGWTLWHGNLEPDRYSNGTVNHNGSVRRYSGYNTDHFTDTAVTFLASQASTTQPFFLWLTYDAPHYPAIPARRHAGMFGSWPLPMPPNFNETDVSDKPPSVRWPLLTATQIGTIRIQYRKRLESLQAVDEGIKRLVDVLQTTGQLDNTVILFTSDNGYYQGHHRIPDHKESYYEEAIRVPLLIRGPGIPVNESRAQLISNVDLAPTIVALAGAIPRRTLDGRSFLPVLDNPAIPWRTALFVDGKRRTKPSSGVGAGGAQIDAVRTDRYLYVEHTNGDREFYDLQTDPYQLESKPTVPTYTGVIADLRRHLATLSHCAGAGCWVTEEVEQ